MNKNPIGVFDSGVGGLSVLKQFLHYLPNENYIYLGDTARVPYGNKSQSIVQEYARQATEFFIDNEVKMIVIACNTVSAVAIEAVQKIAKSIPVIEMIRPASEAAITSSQNSRVGVIGTRATINSEAYIHELKKYDKYSNLKITSTACPLFVPLVEEGYLQSEAAELIARDYLETFATEEIDTLVLGCTHYPFLRDLIHKILPHVKLIDTGEAAAIQAKKIIENENISAGIEAKDGSNIEFYLTDTPYTFTNIAENLLGFKIEKIKKVNLD